MGQEYELGLMLGVGSEKVLRLRIGAVLNLCLVEYLLRLGLGSK